jgi:hypothetical protein
MRIANLREAEFFSHREEARLRFVRGRGARRSQQEPGGARRSQEEPGGARRSQEEPAGARRSQEEPRRARRKARTHAVRF